MKKLSLILLGLVSSATPMCKRRILEKRKIEKQVPLEKVIAAQKKLPLDRQLATLLRYMTQDDQDVIKRAQQLVAICCSIVAESESTTAFPQLAINRVTFDIAQTYKQNQKPMMRSELKNCLKTLKNLNP